MKCKCVYCGIIIDVKGINPQNQECNDCKKLRKRLLNSLYGKKAVNGCHIVIDRELERRVYSLYTYIDKYVNRHSVNALDVYNEMINVLTYIMGRIS